MVVRVATDLWNLECLGRHCALEVPIYGARPMPNASDRSIPDEELVARCQHGDFAAFAELYERYRRPIIAYIGQIVHNYDDAACVAQDVFLSVFEHVGRFDTERRFSTWLFAIARNAAIDHIQARRRRGVTGIESFDEEPAPVGRTVASGNISETLARAESNELLAAAIATLPQIHREIIELVVFQERSYDEAALIIGDGVNANTLRSRMFQALRRLRTHLQDVGGDQGHELI